MKKYQVILALFILISCGGGGGSGGGNSDDDQDQAPTIPVIESIMFLNIVDGVPIPTKRFGPDHLFNLSIVASDDGLDMRKMFIEMDRNGKPYKIYERLLPEQPSATVEYYFADPITNVPAGTWFFCFYIVDSAGNESHEQCSDFLVDESENKSPLFPSFQILVDEF